MEFQLVLLRLLENFLTLLVVYSLLYGEGGVGHAVAQLVEALRYKSEGRGFDSNGVTGIFH